MKIEANCDIYLFAYSNGTARLGFELGNEFETDACFFKIHWKNCDNINRKTDQLFVIHRLKVQSIAEKTTTK